MHRAVLVLTRETDMADTPTDTDLDGPLSPDDIGDESFKLALNALLAAHQSQLEDDLKQAKDPERLKAELLKVLPDCEQEFAFADRLFEGFMKEDVAVRLLPEQALQLLGPREDWRWCLLHLRCCLIFGWLVCRRPRNFRAFNYLLYRYWRCVREVIGQPVATPPRADEVKDFNTLVHLAAAAYRPYLTDQLATVDFPSGIPDEVLNGQIDCFDGEAGAAEVFERLLTPETAQALLGEKAFAAHSRLPWFWFCRCWCLCAMRLGCCLAGAKNSLDIARCLAWYRRCLRQCFRPLTCALTGPNACTDEEIQAALGALVVPVTGTAAGAGFSHYVLEWSLNGITWHASDFRYPPIPPGAGVQGNSPVFGGLLALFDTSLLNPGLYFLRLTVSAVTGAVCVATHSFELSKKDVRILGVDGYSAMDTSWVDPGARFIETVPALCARPASTSEVSFGGCLSVQGGAFVGGCEQRTVKRYTLDYKPGFETDCSSGGWVNFWSVDYSTPVQNRFINRRTDFSTLTSVWAADCMVAPPPLPLCGPPPFRSVPDALLIASCWQSKVSTCGLSGLFTLRLLVEATDGSSYCDTQRVWIDNKTPCAMIRIDAVPKCADLFISQFATPPDCSVPWTLPVSGIAYDELIDPMQPFARPNDNFDHYVVTLTKQGGGTLQLPVMGPGGACFYGTQRVGNPGADCTPCVPHGLPASATIGTLALFDLRALDAVCSSQVPYPVPANFTLRRQECCVYQFDLWVYDRTITSSGVHWAHDSWPIKICNDLPCPPGADETTCARLPGQ